jgi:hypothetical protein
MGKHTVLFLKRHWWQAPAFRTSLAAFLTGASSFRRCLTADKAPGEFSNTTTNSESGFFGSTTRLLLLGGSGLPRFLLDPVIVDNNWSDVGVAQLSSAGHCNFTLVGMTSDVVKKVIAVFISAGA